MSHITVDLQRKSFFPGQIVKGTINVMIEKHIKVRAVQLEIVGFEKTKVIIGSGRSSDAVIEKNYILQDKVYLKPPKMGEEYELDSGDYTSEFEFRIPYSAPPSYDGKFVKIKYWLKIRVDAYLGRDIVSKKPFKVIRSRKAQESFTHSVSFQSWNYMDHDSDRPGFHIKFPSKSFRAGKAIKGNITICNKDACKMRKVKFRLIGIENARAKGHQRSYEVKTYKFVYPVEHLVDGIPAGFHIPLQRNIPRSYEGLNSNFKWEIEIQLDLSFKTDIKERFPVEII
jgi:hypothetical protein